jgi:hypothetical protein
VVFGELVTEKRVIPAAIRTIMFWKPGPLTKVGRNGVRCNGLTYGLDESSLMIHWQGKEVSVRIDPNEANRAAVCSPDGKFICLARCNQRLPWNATAEQKGKAIAAIKRRKKEVAAYHNHRPQMTNDVADEMWQQQADKSRQEREARQIGIPLVTVSTPMNGQLAQINHQLEATAPQPRALAAPKQFNIVEILNEPTPDRSRSRLLEWCESQGEIDRKTREAAEQDPPVEGSELLRWSKLQDERDRQRIEEYFSEGNALKVPESEVG